MERRKWWMFLLAAPLALPFAACEDDDYGDEMEEEFDEAGDELEDLGD